MAVIAVDAMGGDNAPDEIVEGAILAAADGIDVLLVGATDRLERLVGDRTDRIAIRHADQVIEFDEDPAHAIREKRTASIAVAAKAVSGGDADALVSAGSTGAAMTAATFLIGRLPGVSRPAIASIYPTGKVVMDVGANLECRAEHLGQFGVMGAALANVYLELDAPRVGLLNIGEEDTKGRSLEREAFALMRDNPAFDFIGNVEGRDIAGDTVDVIVTDGFTGNVMLKTSEGAGRVIQQMMFEVLARPEYQEAVASLMPAFAELRERLSPDSVGGAHLVGTKGVVVIAHGSSSRVAVRNAIEIAAEGVRHDLVTTIAAGISAAS